MSLASDLAVLRRVPFFEGFDDEHLRLLAFGGENQRFSAGATLFQKGDPTEGGLVILSGQVALSDPAKPDEKPEKLKAASLVGQRALLTTTKRRHTCTALSDVDALFIRRTVFKRMLSEFPELASRLMAQLSGDLLSLTDQASALVGSRSIRRP